jgi:YD repeat-containing protein
MGQRRNAAAIGGGDSTAQVGDRRVERTRRSLKGGGGKEFELNHDANGLLNSVEYMDGNSIEFGYDLDGALMAVTDTATGMKIWRVEKQWMMTNLNGEVERIDGSLSVDQATGCVSCRLKNGREIRTNPDGSTEVID